MLGAFLMAIWLPQGYLFFLVVLSFGKLSSFTLAFIELSSQGTLFFGVILLNMNYCKSLLLGTFHRCYSGFRGHNSMHVLQVCIYVCKKELLGNAASISCTWIKLVDSNMNVQHGKPINLPITLFTEESWTNSWSVWNIYL